MSPTWNERYAVSGIGEPGPPDALTDRVDGVDRVGLVPVTGRALDVACGRGTVAIWLALRGLAVDAVDVAPAGLALGARLAARAGAAVNWVEADLDGWSPASGPYDVIVVQRFRDPALYRPLVAALRPGGLLAMTVLSQVGAGPGRFRAAPGELERLAAASALEVVAHTEAVGEASLVARRRAGPAG